MAWDGSVPQALSSADAAAGSPNANASRVILNLLIRSSSLILGCLFPGVVGSARRPHRTEPTAERWQGDDL